VGFRMGGDDAPFSQRMWGLGARMAPTARGRSGCTIMLVVTLIVIVAALIFAAVIGTF
jgi:hypothetical protein